MTRDRLEELNAISNDIDALEKVLHDIKMLCDLGTNCSGGFYITGSNFCHYSVVRNLCDKFKPIVEAELARLNSAFSSD